MQDTTTIKAGDTLVPTDPDSAFTITIDDVTDDGVEVTDSRGEFRSGAFDVEQVESAAGSDDFRVVRDSNLTEIKGIGPSTAPLVEAKTGCETPVALAEQYLTERDSVVEDALRRVDYFREWLIESAESLIAGTSREQVLVLLYLKQAGASRMDDISDAAPTQKHGHGADASALVLSDLDWRPGAYWTNASNTVGVGISTTEANWVAEGVGVDVGEYEPATGYTQPHPGLTDYSSPDGYRTAVSDDLLDDVLDLIGETRDSASVRVSDARDDHPLIIDVDGTDLVFSFGARIIDR